MKPLSLTRGVQGRGPRRRVPRPIARLAATPLLLLFTALPVAAAEPALPGVDLTADIVFQLLASEIAAQRGQIGSATATYLALARKTRDPRLAQRATEFALTERSIDRALQSARLWRELAPASPTATQTLETLLISTGRLAEARPLISARLVRARGSGDLPEAYAQLQRALARSPDKTAALALLDELAATDAQLPEARLAIAGLAQAAGLAERAAQEAGKAHALRPDDERLALTAARLLQESSGNSTASLRLLAGFLERQPASLEVRFQYARLLAAAGRADDARREMDAALRQSPDNPAILFSLAQFAQQAGQPEVAAGHLRRLVAQPGVPEADKAGAYVFLAQVAEERKQFDEAIDWLGRITEGEAAWQALLRRALLTARVGRIDAALALLAEANPVSPRDRAQRVATQAQVLREAGRSAEAFAALDQALGAQPDNPDLLYDHAMAAERLDRIDVMEASLRKLISARPDHAHAHNALGYSLADRGLRLEEAQALIERALQLLPDDPHILDSMGWVLFRRGQNERAAEYLRRAYALSPEAEIAAHLGEVLWKLGRADEARALWAEARRREPDNATLKDTLARLNVAL
ncbi:MAG: tetratricopeptide repeat protein [Burkholderiales bacterium]